MALMLNLQRAIRQYDRSVQQDKVWDYSVVQHLRRIEGQVMGIAGLGRIGQSVAKKAKGFDMEVIAYDPYPAEGSGIEYVPLDTLFRESDVISLHCPLTESSHHIIDREALGKMKDGAFLLNTSRGALVDSEALLEALTAGKLRGAALDVYEEEANLFYEDMSDKIIKDDTLALLVSRPNVLITSHQAFLTEEALDNIASVTIQNFDEFFAGKPLTNEIKLK